MKRSKRNRMRTHLTTQPTQIDLNENEETKKKNPIQTFPNEKITTKDL